MPYAVLDLGGRVLASRHERIGAKCLERFDASARVFVPRMGGLVAVVKIGTSGWALPHGWRTESILLSVPSVTLLLLACSVALDVRAGTVRITADPYLPDTALDLEPQ